VAGETSAILAISEIVKRSFISNLHKKGQWKRISL
jgi:hypothetical protein